MTDYLIYFLIFAYLCQAWLVAKLLKNGEKKDGILIRQQGLIDRAIDFIERSTKNNKDILQNNRESLNLVNALRSENEHLKQKLQ